MGDIALSALVPEKQIKNAVDSKSLSSDLGQLTIMNR